MVLNTKTKILTTLILTIPVVVFTLWEHFHGGVISHHIFADESMPKVSNWWGLLSIPLLTWILLSIIQKRRGTNHDEKRITRPEVYGFIGGISLGIVITILFYNAPTLTSYILLLTFVLALFVPIYKPEFYLGFILSMAYGFGGVLPVVFGLLLIAIFAIEYLLIRKAFIMMINKISTHQ